MEWAQLVASMFGGAMRTSTPAGPAISSANPFDTSFFDSSGWAVNFGGGSQDARSSPTMTAPNVTAPPPSIAGAITGLGQTEMLLMLGGVVLVLWLRK